MSSALGRALIAAGCVFGLLGATGCVRDRVDVSGTTVIEPLTASGVPAKLLDLTVAAEDVDTALEQFDRSYFEALALYSLRKDKLLHATLQVARLNDVAERTPRFEETVVGQVGGALATTQLIGGRTVYLTSATKQRVAIWFTDDYLFVLATRDDYPQPRTLLRAALAIEPGASE